MPPKCHLAEVSKQGGLDRTRLCPPDDVLKIGIAIQTPAFAGHRSSRARAMMDRDLIDQSPIETQMNQKHNSRNQRRNTRAN